MLLSQENDEENYVFLYGCYFYKTCRLIVYVSTNDKRLCAKGTEYNRLYFK